MKLFSFLLPVALAFVVDLLIYRGSMQSRLLHLLLRMCEDKVGEDRWRKLIKVLKSEDVELLKYDHTILGAESFVQDPDGGVYTGLLDGRIVKLISDAEYEEVICLGERCDGRCNWQRARKQQAAADGTEVLASCSRPLGMHFAFPSSASSTSRSSSLSSSHQKALFVCDAFKGLLRVPLQAEKSSASQEQKGEQKQADHGDTSDGAKFELMIQQVEGRHLHFPNALADVMIEGKRLLLLTDSSKDNTVGQGARILTEATGTGRLIIFDPATGEAQVALRDIAFPNGLAVIPDQQAVLVVEGGKRQILKYYLAGPRAGKTEVWAEDLPIIPDNITPLRDGSGYLLAGAASRKLAALLPTPVSAGRQLLRALGARLFNWTIFQNHLQTLGKALHPLLQIDAVNAAAEWLLSKAVAGGHILVLNSDGEIKQWIALPRRCALTSEAVVAHWGKVDTAAAASGMKPPQNAEPAARGKDSGSFILVGSFLNVPVCKVPLAVLSKTSR